MNFRLSFEVHSFRYSNSGVWVELEMYLCVITICQNGERWN